MTQTEIPSILLPLQKLALRFIIRCDAIPTGKLIMCETILCHSGVFIAVVVVVVAAAFNQLRVYFISSIRLRINIVEKLSKQAAKNTKTIVITIIICFEIFGTLLLISSIVKKRHARQRAAGIHKYWKFVFDVACHFVFFRSLIYEICRKWVDCVNKMSVLPFFSFHFVLFVRLIRIVRISEKKAWERSLFDYHELNPFESKNRCDLFMPETKYGRSAFVRQLLCHLSALLLLLLLLVGFIFQT